MKKKKIVFILLFFSLFLFLFIFKNRGGGFFTKNEVSKTGSSSASSPSSAQWAYSTNKIIVLEQPVANVSIKSNDTISGHAVGINNVAFVLSDDRNGVIDQGILNVSNGRFSGKLIFKSHGNLGTLQVYYPDPSNGSIQDTVTIDISYAK
jgi:hypothetical protein